MLSQRRSGRTSPQLAHDAVECRSAAASQAASDLQHQLHLRQAEIEQRDFALLAMQSNIESTKAILKQQQSELQWLSRQRDVANRIITHLRNELEFTKRAVAQPTPTVCARCGSSEAPADPRAHIEANGEACKTRRTRGGVWRQLDEAKDRIRQLTKENMEAKEAVSRLSVMLRDREDLDRRRAEEANQAMMLYEDIECARRKAGEKLQKETRLLTKEKECLRVELREKSSDVYTLEKNLKELQTQLTQSQWELEDTQRQQKKRLLAQSQEHEKEINLLEERMRKSSVPLPSRGSSSLLCRNQREREQSCRKTFGTCSSGN
ncbi:hypothetical protein CSUI_005722 [Cystoisospora suis]|uniref:Uncharacterized protein n=1 Tax=Cystoisospora suis TaxID=483139 RepID=A0A2C6KSU1_9APIC|nr:hypothetical protein CSUI_005722 [Cystoisospora suis]